MTVYEIRSVIHACRALDWDRRLFDELIPTPEGTTYNAYLIRGSERTALIDTVDPRATEELLRDLRSLKISSLDYLIVNHAEQDHSGSIPRILQEFPGTTVIADEKCRDFLKSLLLLPDDVFQVIQDGETLSLGDRTLEFLITPWVHWPETMLTYLQEERILFTCDLFGSHLASSYTYASERPEVLISAKRYYAEIMMPFRASIQKHLGRLEQYDISLIAPSHGPLYDHPPFILESYREWVSGQVQNTVVIAYVSMHGSTRQMVSHLTAALIQRGVAVQPFNLTVTDLGMLAMALVDAATVVVGTPTVLFNPHPAAIQAAHLVSILHPPVRYLCVIGSFGWGGQAVKRITDLFEKKPVEVLDPVYIQGYPTETDFRALDALAERIAEKHRADSRVMKE